ncbi:MAG: hypothetical protein H7A23_14025 [Leptospiraceae bacterium]|nr:hypothetical protein [Leptospiraceae bacterium]MCP5495667.1 hypothetical protein [Leptospiraceae bacterium]
MEKLFVLASNFKVDIYFELQLSKVFLMAIFWRTLIKSLTCFINAIIIMIMKLNYIYNLQGQIEYAVIPYEIWKKVEKFVPIQEKQYQKNEIYDPKPFRGMLRHLKLNIEIELKNMREEWTINI